MRVSYKQGLRRFIALCPITAAIILTSLLLHAAVMVYELRGEKEVYRRLGSVETLTLFHAEDRNGPLVAIPQMSGPFDLWDGEWWRILVSAFLHGGLLHLVMNGLGLAALGWLLEPRMGRIRFLLFFLAGTMISMVPEFLLEHQAVGLSGGLYAMFGALLPLRRRDPEVAEILTPQAVRFGLAWLVGCVVATQLEIVNIANGAHFAGFIYGWIVGQVLFGAVRHSKLARWSFIAMHLLLIPAVYFTMHPVWNGRYYWYQAYGEQDREKQTELLKQAVARDPSLRLVWDELSKIEFQNGNRGEAWRLVVEGLHHNRSNEHALKLARDIWSRMTADERRAGRETVRTYFAEDTETWLVRLKPEHDPAMDPLLSPFRTKPAARTTPEREPGVKQNLAAPPVNPQDPASAAEGVEL